MGQHHRDTASTHASTSRESWIRQGNFRVWEFQVSVIGGLDSHEPPEPESFEQVLKIVKERSRTQQQQSLVSVVIDKEDFLPVSFLNTGVKQSLPVCRIARYFSRDDFQAFIADIEQEIETHKHVRDKFADVAKVVEIFSIPDQVAREIFNQPATDNISRGLKTPLQILKSITENQLLKVNPIPIGTGFLVGGTHLLTNHHVIPTPAIARKCVAQFNYAEDGQGYIRRSIDYEFDPKILFASEPNLDYTLVQLKSGMFTRQAGYEFGWIQLIEDDETIKPGLTWIEFSGERTKAVSALERGKAKIDQLTSEGYITQVDEIANSDITSLIIWHPDENRYQQDEALLKELGTLFGDTIFAETPGKSLIESDRCKTEPGDPIFIVQHPKGKQKQVVLSDNQVIKNGLYKTFVRYRADSDYGSSGSPVFDANWKLVALHHAAVPSMAADPVAQHSTQSIAAQQGIRICRIVNDLKQKSCYDPKLKSFLQDFVVTAEQLNYPPLPAGLEFDGIGSYVILDDSTIAFASFDNDTVRLWNWSGVELETLVLPQISVSNTSYFANSRYITDISFRSDGSAILCACGQEQPGKVSGFLHCFSLDTGDNFSFPETDWRQNRVSFSPKNPEIVSSGAIMQPYNPDFSEGIQLWSSDGTLLKTLQQPDATKRIRCICFSPDGERIVVAQYEQRAGKSEIILWQRDGALLKTWTGLSGIVTSLCFSPDSKVLASAGSSGAIQFWSLEQDIPSAEFGSLIKTWNAHAAAINSMSFSPDGEILASAANDNTVKLWSCDGTLLQSLKGHTSPVIEVCFSRDGKTLATAYLEQIKLWSRDGQELLSLKNPGRYIRFNPTSLDHLNRTKSAQFSQEPGSPSLFKSAAMTIEAWVTPEQRGGTVISNSLAYSPLNQSVHESVGCRLEIETDGTVSFRTPSSLSGAGPRYRIPGITPYKAARIPFGQFSHVAVTCSDSPGSVKVYVNGKQYDYEGIEVNPISPLPFIVGAHLEAPLTSQEEEPALVEAADPFLTGFFQGAIAEVRIWDRVRSGDEIRATMHQRLSGHQEELAAQGLVGYWKFEEGDGNQVHNYIASKTGYGRVCGTTKWFSAVQPITLPLPYGLQFNREEDWVDGGQDESLKLDAADEAITVEAWVKHQFGNGLIVSRGTAEESGYVLAWRDGKIWVDLWDHSSDFNHHATVVTRGCAPLDHAWHHLAFTWDQRSQEIGIYIDGKWQNGVVTAGNCRSIQMQEGYKTIALFAGSLSRVTATLQIGRRVEDNHYFHAAIAEVRLWKCVRNQVQIKSWMYRRLNGNEPGLVGYWRLDDGGEGKAVRNFVPTGKPGTIGGAVPWKWFPASLDRTAASSPRSDGDVDPSNRSSLFTPVDILGHWAEPFIRNLIQRKVMGHFADYTFQPDARVTRTDYEQLMTQTFGLTPPHTLSDPNRILTRIEAIVFLVNRLQLTGGDPNLLTLYNDFEPILKNTSAEVVRKVKAALVAATSKHIVVNYPDPHQLEPMRTITRAEVAGLLYQALVALGRAEAIASPFIFNPPDPLLPLSDTVLRFDDKGTAVKALQTRLKELGYYQGEIDGDFGPLTEVAVVHFQRSQGLTVDGIVGPAVIARLRHPN